MKIEVTSIKKIEKENSRMKGMAKVLIDDCFLVEDIRIIEGDNGLFIAMPSKDKRVVNEDGVEEIKHHDMAHPINQETRKMFEDAIFEAYQNQAE